MTWVLDDLGGGIRWRLRLVQPGPNGELAEFDDVGMRTGAHTMIHQDFATGPNATLADQCRLAWVALKQRGMTP